MIASPCAEPGKHLSSHSIVSTAFFSGNTKKLPLNVKLVGLFICQVGAKHIPRKWGEPHDALGIPNQL